MPKEGEIVTVTFQYTKLPSQDELADDERELFLAAREALQFAHSPYSNYLVGAAVRLQSGLIITGSNQENASYGLTNCAERSALFAVGSQGHKKDVTKIAVLGKGRDFETTEPVTPCGACRQVIKEYEDLAQKPLVIIAGSSQGDIYRFVGIDSLLPFSFGPKDLKIQL